ncbi:hypothetical protein [Pseudoalteromonas sp. SR41-6]|uniref:hypothetical protein n=1 Tax=Pseudoalteromonas sp. SR41-6 TaxID=2760948 RepID=UPI001600261F|nr:hypothetical protein [Pseudoalteromonas sp. SR41-6]MBB1333941.1 hypothetical protein [Pseudoalteromonas sp. SR41-6]
MKKIFISKKDLIQAIEDNCSDFGNPFSGLYVDVEGCIACTEKSSSGNSMAILTFSGMGEFVDENGLYADDENYDAAGVAKYIVEEGECLNLSGSLLSDDGSEIEYKFEII